MSSNDCRVIGMLKLKENVTEMMIHIALADFVDYTGTDFATETGEGNIEFEEEENMLHLSIDFHGNGGYQDVEVDALVDALSAIVTGGQWVTILDFDTGDSDEAKVPRFIGTDEEKYQGRLQYGISMMEWWVAPLIGEQAFRSVAAYIKAQPTIELDS